MDKYYIHKLDGICSLLVTPLNKDESLDEDGFRRIIDYQKKANIDSIFICGADSEGPSLTNKVRAKALEIALENFENKPILLGIFESGTQKSVQTIEELLKIIDNNENVFLTVAPPIYFSPAHTKKEILDFYKSINDIGLPIILYSNPKYTGLTFSVEQIQELSEQENIVGLKFSKDNIGNLKKIRQSTPNEFKIGFANREPLVGAFDVGANFLINTTACIAPKTFSDLYSHYKQGDIERTKLLEQEIISFYDIYDIGPGNISVAKTAMNILVNCKNYMSSPFELPSNEQKEKIREFLKNKGLI